jgi:hypothetical protein
MDFDPKLNPELNEALKAIQEARLAGKNDKELPRMVAVLQIYLACQYHAPPAIKSSIEAIENEIARRQKDRHQAGLMVQGKNLHGETMAELGKLKTSVDQLARARCVDKWILVAGWIAAIASVIAVALSIFLKH